MNETMYMKWPLMIDP